MHGSTLGFLKHVYCKYLYVYKKTNQYFFGFSQIKLLSSICIAEKQLQSV